VETWKTERVLDNEQFGLNTNGALTYSLSFSPKGNTEYTQFVSLPLASAAPKEDYHNTLLLQPL